MKKFSEFLTVLVIICLSNLQVSAEDNISTVTLGKSDVLNYLSNLENKAISGQFVGYAHEFPDEEDVVDTYAGTETPVAMIGTDYGYSTDISLSTQPLIDFWDGGKGGLVTISWHANNPWTLDNPRTRGDPKDLPGGPLSELITSGNNAYDNWEDELRNIADELIKLKEAGVVVLWRPFHEMNGTWFWWGNRNQYSDKETYITDFQNLWKDMYNYFSDRELTNLIWVYAPNDPGHNDSPDSENSLWFDDEFKWPVLEHYNGLEDYIDIVGLDYYVTSHKEYYRDGKDPNEETITLYGYDDLVSTNKPIGLTEFGPVAFETPSEEANIYDYSNLLEVIKSEYPKITFFQAWNAQSSIIRNENYRSFLGDNWVITKDELSVLSAPISAPTLTVTTIGTTVMLSWTPVDNATGYTLYYAPPDVSYIGDIDMGTQTSFSYDLWEGAAFYVAVKAYTSTDRSDYSNIEFFIIQDNTKFYGKYQIDTIYFGPCADDPFIIEIGDDSSRKEEQDYYYITRNDKTVNFSGYWSDDEDDFTIRIEVVNNSLDINLNYISYFDPTDPQTEETDFTLMFSDDYNNITISGNHSSSNPHEYCTGAVAGTGYRID